ncbi:MAG TPA: bifunctional riboflavin kinase/FAD synthetase [Solirubrobacteraceae bacterium]|nr:bifunctional riboflavin kinase/FAD synthetase [Solirubrobacteraceae bacterium]
MSARVVSLPEVEPRPRRVAVGTFDGVHLGHREVIRGADAVLTFDPHPVSVVHPAAAPKLLTTVARKAELVAAMGVEELVVVPFDAAFAARSAQSFLDDVLVARLHAIDVSVGENFRFGHRAKGDADLLRGDGRFSTRVVELLEVDGEIVSSSHIRGLIAGGAVAYAAKLLGDPYLLAGVVVHGDEVGRDLGYPTANLVPDDALAVPGHGVYAARAELDDGSEHPAAVSIGVRPTFASGRGELVEAFLLDWEGDLYDRILRLRFLERLRGERRFDSADALVEQMHRDVDRARAVAVS